VRCVDRRARDAGFELAEDEERRRRCGAVGTPAPNRVVAARLCGALADSIRLRAARVLRFNVWSVLEVRAARHEQRRVAARPGGKTLSKAARKKAAASAFASMALLASAAPCAVKYQADYTRPARGHTPPGHRSAVVFERGRPDPYAVPGVWAPAPRRADEDDDGPIAAPKVKRAKARFRSAK
jgi:hypothetical protein